MDNRIIWDGWSPDGKTDLSQTKTSKLDGRQVTSINANYFFERATSLFGPCGIGWGYKIESEEFKDTRALKDGSREVIHTILIELWYRIGGEKGTIQSYGHTFLVQGADKGAYGKPNEDYAKKSLTDAIKKALSMLGFCNDVYAGDYNDAGTRGARTSIQTEEKALNAREELDRYLATVPAMVESCNKLKPLTLLFDQVLINYRKKAEKALLTQQEAGAYWQRIQNYKAKKIQEINNLKSEAE